MAGKKIKSKKAISSASYTPPVAPSIEEQEDLMDDLFAELDARDQSLQPQSSLLQETNNDKTRETSESASKKQDAKSRHLARQARKAAALAQNFAPSNPEADGQLERETKQEMMSIKRICDELGVHIHEINPDGHCLFSAIADQLAVLDILPANLANYAAVRVAASDYIYRHADEFLPFLTSSSGEDGVASTGGTGLLNAQQFEQYCLNIRNTGAWGGEPEILALSRAYNVPIQVVQGGNPPVVLHSPDGDSSVVLDRGAKVVRISFHRRMYGLGEHYNSLRPRNALTTVTDKIQSMLS